MKIELKKLLVRDITDGYADSGEQGVVGYGGNLDIRPKYQRAYVYTGNQRNAVIRTVFRGFPLNVMYWAVNGNGKYEVLDGQQRTISLCQFRAGEFMFPYQGTLLNFPNLPAEAREKFLSYELQIYFCEGSEDERLDWFRTVNIAGERLFEQELRNAVYCGSWVSDAKRYFSANNAAAYRIGKHYVKGQRNRQEYLETAIKWHCGSRADKDICAYMLAHRNDQDANALWLYFREVIDWTKATFPDTRKEMQGVDWGSLYAAHGKDRPDIGALAARVKTLMADDEIQRRSGIYGYVLDGDETRLNLRQFPDNIKGAVYERQGGKCRKCKKEISLDEAQADHIDPWSKGGKTESNNCQILCDKCNRRKSDK